MRLMMCASIFRKQSAIQWSLSVKLRNIIILSTCRGILEEFDGIVSGVRAHGIYVELPNTVEGFVSFDSLDEYYIVDEKTYTAVGEVSGKTLTLGQPVRIKVSEVVPEDGYIDFDII